VDAAVQLWQDKSQAQKGEQQHPQSSLVDSKQCRYRHYGSDQLSQAPSDVNLDFLTPALDPARRAGTAVVQAHPSTTVP
jgi:hypothetical protein